MELYKNRKPILQLVGYRLKKLRERKGVTQTDVARFIGVMQSAYARYENGYGKLVKEPLELTCKYFNVDKDYLDADSMKLNFLTIEMLDFMFTKGNEQEVRKMFTEYLNQGKNQNIKTSKLKSVDSFLDLTLK